MSSSGTNDEQVMISIHALREEGDGCWQAPCWPHQYFYPRPPRGGRLCDFGLVPVVFLFLSTPSARRATQYVWKPGEKKPISIHALREEGDVSQRRCLRFHLYFYPRPPRGGRLVRKASFDPQFIFLSTPSARRATDTRTKAYRKGVYFYPRPPRGGRRRADRGLEVFCAISIHALREEGDVGLRIPTSFVYKFLSTPSARRATEALDAVELLFDISIHALREEGDPRFLAART